MAERLHRDSSGDAVYSVSLLLILSNNFHKQSW